MSKHVVECTRCHRHWNHKHQGDNCPDCGWYRFTSDTPASPEALRALQEHFRGPRGSGVARRVPEALPMASPCQGDI